MPNYPFEFPIDVHTKAGAVKAFRGGNDFAVPEFNASASALQVTTTPLAASGTFVGTTCDRLAVGAGGTPTETPAPNPTGVFVTKYRAIAYADQPGTLYIEESEDDNTWTETITQAVSANQLMDTGWAYLSKRYYRLRFVNGATAQTVFSLLDSAGGGLADVSASLTGSNVQNVTFVTNNVSAATPPSVGTNAKVEFEVFGTGTGFVLTPQLVMLNGSGQTVPTQAFSLATQSLVSTITANGAYEMDVAGWDQAELTVTTAPTSGNTSAAGKWVAVS